MPLGIDGGIDALATKQSPDCFSQMLTHLEPRVSCTACNSLGRQIAAPTRTNKIRLCNSIKKEHPVGALLFYIIILIRSCHR